jgi:hypothetical protein
MTATLDFCLRNPRGVSANWASRPCGFALPHYPKSRHQSKNSFPSRRAKRSRSYSSASIVRRRPLCRHYGSFTSVWTRADNVRYVDTMSKRRQICDEIGSNISVEINRRLPVVGRLLVFRRRQTCELLGSGQAIRRSVDGTALRTRPRSRSRHGSQSGQSPRRLFRAETQLPPFGARSDNGASIGRPAW